MEWLRVVLDAVFAVGGLAAFGFVAFGAWLTFRHAGRLVGEEQGRFAQAHRHRARRQPRVSPESGRFA